MILDMIATKYFKEFDLDEWTRHLRASPWITVPDLLATYQPTFDFDSVPTLTARESQTFGVSCHG